MIISTGSLKFKKVKSIKNTGLRPTSSKIREAIFNILIHKLELDKWKSEGYMLDAFVIPNNPQIAFMVSLYFVSAVLKIC